MHEKEFSFEKLRAWQKARELVKLIYSISKLFPDEERFGITSQIRRSAVSIVANIAEGSGRTSKADQRNYYKISYSSALETLSWIIISYDLGFVNQEQYGEARKQISEVSYLINQLSKSTT